MMILSLWVCVCYSMAEMMMTPWGFRLGAPTTSLVCRDMFPVGHGVDAQLLTQPYDITLSQNIYTAAEELHVTVAAKNEVVHPITGLFVQARMADCSHPSSTRPIGTFRLLDGTRYLKTVTCDNRANSAVSHVINRELGYHRFVWKAPAETVGPVYIRATVVSTKKVFWTNVTSQIIRDFSRVTTGQYCHIQQYLDLEIANNTVTWTTRADNQGTNDDKRTTHSPRSTSDYRETTRHQHQLKFSTDRMIISTPNVCSKAYHSCSLSIILLVILFSALQ